MKLSLKWINEFVDIADFFAKPRELADVLVEAGLDVEQIENPGEMFHHVVVGQIVELGKHPNADKLTLCQVDVNEKADEKADEKKPRQIVCGAKNHKQGDKVVVATPGAILPGDFAIQISKIRGVESQGMLCSESELGFKKESEGILILPQDAPVGEAFAKYRGMDDIIFDLSITPNRADCLSHLGLAREISCLLGRTLKAEALSNSLRSGAVKNSAKNKVTVEVRDHELCPRYCGRTIYDVKIGASPAWLKQRLESLGVNSVNNVVDVTNYVMLERGQPLHAFDLSQLRGRNTDQNADQKITVARSVPGEIFKTFSGTELKLSGEELTIRDGERAVALAGVIGGLNSGVSDSTKDIFLEAAYFTPKGVRHTSRRLSVETDSSYRFSRGVDINGVLEAMERATQLFAEFAQGVPSTDHVDVYPKPAHLPRIVVREQTLSDRLGYNVDLNDFVQVAKRLHCTVHGAPAKSAPAKNTAITRAVTRTITVEPPSFRVDLEIEMDLVEEYGRLNGYDKIPEAFPPLQERPAEHAKTYIGEEMIRGQLVRSGFFEARNYAFLSPKWQAEFVNSTTYANSGLELHGGPVQIRNPLSEETSVMRLSLLPGLIQNLLYNEHHGVAVGRLFEAGSVFSQTAANFQEPQRLALIAWGNEKSLWQKSAHPVVYDIQSVLNALAYFLGSRIELRKFDAAPTFLHPGQSAQVFYQGKTVGFLGSLHPLIRERHKIRSDTAVAELDLAALLQGALVHGQRRIQKMKPISKFPSVERDFSLVVSHSVTAAELVRETQKAIGPLLQDVEVFDVFRGAGIPDDHQSVSIRLTLQDMNTTLSEDRLQAITAALLHRLAEKFAAKIR